MDKINILIHASFLRLNKVNMIPISVKIQAI